jgi:drug/metabolite transporter (DMT)-like permease
MLPRVYLLLAALLFSTGGAAIKATVLTSWQVAGLRSAIAMALLVVTSRGRLRLTGRVALVGLVYATTLVSFVTANKLTTAAHAVFLQAAAPVYLVLMGPWLLRERLDRRDLPFLAVVAAGIALLFTGGNEASATAPNPVLGNLIGVGSGVAWALTLAGLRWLERDQTPGASASGATVWGNAFAAIACLPFALPFAATTAIDWVAVSYLGVFQLGLAYVVLNRGIGQVTAVEASILLLLEPALNPLWAYLVHGESPGVLASLGGLLVLVATTVRTVWVARRT